MSQPLTVTTPCPRSTLLLVLMAIVLDAKAVLMPKRVATSNQDFSQSFSEVAGEALANQDFSQQQNLSSQCFAPTVYTGETVKINGTKPQSLAAITQNYKSVSTRQINRMNKAKGNVIWQRNYYEHIIRNEEALNNIREYIVNNSINWVKDQENPANFQTMQLLSNKNPIRFI